MHIPMMLLNYNYAVNLVKKQRFIDLMLVLCKAIKFQNPLHLSNNC